jgi:sigma-B regulation protein RsbU (phosphoserine phosphatase)
MELSSLLTQLNVLIQLMCVIIVAAYILTRSRIFPEILDNRATLSTKIILVLLFGAMSIYGSVSGIDFMGSMVNVRDLGPMLAGLLAGPWVGIGAGLIGAAFRLTMGGMTVYACSLAAVFAGLFGGIVWLWKKKQFAGTTVAVLLAVVMESFHMALTLAMVTPFDTALAVVTRVYIPMVIANAGGMYVFCLMVENFRHERELQEEHDARAKDSKE